MGSFRPTLGSFSIGSRSSLLPGRRQKRIDVTAELLLLCQTAGQLGQGHVQDAEPEGSENGDSPLRLFGQRRSSQQQGAQRRMDEVQVAFQLRSEKPGTR